MIKVELLSHTENPEQIIAASGNLCYSNKNIDEVLDMCDVKRHKMIGKLSELGHLSTFEHASFSFGIEGISRACSHQLVRHRLASYSQKSQRYVKENEQFEFTIPKSINDANLSSPFQKRMEMIQEWYKEALEAGVPAEDARFYLPNAATTKIIVTMNARELLHFLELRTCNRAQWEIRNMANKMLVILQDKFPIIFKKAGAKCVTSGYCPEGDKTCGRLNHKI